jgi:hypothetical protein
MFQTRLFTTENAHLRTPYVTVNYYKLTPYCSMEHCEPYNIIRSQNVTYN